MKVFLKPVPGAIVRNPISFKPLPEKGEKVDLAGAAGQFWKRRIRQGDVIKVDAQTPEVRAEVKEQKKKKGEQND
ncbi:MAG: DUF2635 domain-containing protein [bacterium]|nr:DUF2635 domain-containing protein [bacterium]